MRLCRLRKYRIPVRIINDWFVKFMPSILEMTQLKMSTRARLQRKLAMRQQAQKAQTTSMALVMGQMDRFQHEGKLLEMEVAAFNALHPKNPEDGRRIHEKCELYKRLLGVGNPIERDCDICQKKHQFIESSESKTIEEPIERCRSPTPTKMSQPNNE